MTKRKRIFLKEFKKQVVQLWEAGKPQAKVVKDYDLTPSFFDKWIQHNKTTDSSEEKDNRTPEQEKLIKLRKKLKIYYGK